MAKGHRPAHRPLAMARPRSPTRGTGRLPPSLASSPLHTLPHPSPPSSPQRQSTSSAGVRLLAWPGGRHCVHFRTVVPRSRWWGGTWGGRPGPGAAGQPVPRSPLALVVAAWLPLAGGHVALASASASRALPVCVPEGGPLHEGRPRWLGSPRGPSLQEDLQVPASREGLEGAGFRLGQMSSPDGRRFRYLGR